MDLPKWMHLFVTIMKCYINVLLKCLDKRHDAMDSTSLCDVYVYVPGSREGLACWTTPHCVINTCIQQQTLLWVCAFQSYSTIRIFLLLYCMQEVTAIHMQSIIVTSLKNVLYSPMLQCQTQPCYITICSHSKTVSSFPDDDACICRHPEVGLINCTG